MSEDGFWQERWTAGQIGFHEGRVNARLERYADRLLGKPNAHKRVLMPLSGKSFDMQWLAERGNEVIGCELVELAARAFFDERGIEPEVSRRDPYDVLSATLGNGRVTILIGDVLQLNESHTGALDGVFDRAALIALPAPVRARYVPTILDLLPKAAPILLIGFEHDASSGPPFSVDDNEVRSLYGERCDIELLSRDDVLAESPHITFKGATRVHETSYLLAIR